MNKKNLSFYGLKWNPFAADAPARSFLVSQRIERLLWRVESLAGEGGFALLTGDPGTGKSIALRVLVDRLGALRDVEVRSLTRPQCSIADFYRELGELFGMELRPHNRWAGAKALRQKWEAYIEGAFFRPVLVIDEAQEMQPNVLSELRFLASSDLDARSLLTVVLAGDARLTEKFRSAELLPLATRMRVRVALEHLSPEDIGEHLRHVMAEAGNAKLMTAELVNTIAEHAVGSLRSAMIMAGEILEAGAQRDGVELDERLYFEVIAAATAAPPPETRRQRGKSRP